MKLFILAIIIILLPSLSSCNSHSEKGEVNETRKMVLKYEDGAVFCEGSCIVKKEKGKPVHRIGIWKFFFPNGKLESSLEYDDYGNIISRKEYLENGTLIFSGVEVDNVTTSTEYYDDGKIKLEKVRKIDTESNEEYNTETEYVTEKFYYFNGQLYSSSNYEDGKLDGDRSIWDSIGNLVMKVRYENGIIVEQLAPVKKRL